MNLLKSISLWQVTKSVDIESTVEFEIFIGGDYICDVLSNIARYHCSLYIYLTVNDCLFILYIYKIIKLSWCKLVLLWTKEGEVSLQVPCKM